jgi:hypothetical protein
MTARMLFVDSKNKPIGPTAGVSYLGISKGATLIFEGREYDVVSTSFELKNDAVNQKVVLREIKPSFVALLSAENRHTVGSIMFILSVVLIIVGYLKLTGSPVLANGAAGIYLRWGVPLTIAVFGIIISNAIDRAYLDKRPTLWGLYLSFAFSFGGLWMAVFWLAYFAPPQALDSLSDYASYVSYFRSVFDPIQPALAVTLGWLSLALGFLGLEGIGKIVSAIKGK